MTRSDTEVAPSLRLALTVAILMLSGPSLYFFYMSIVAPDDFSLENKKKFYLVANVINPVVFATNVVIFLSRPKGMNKRLEKAAYFFSLANSVIISIGAKKIDQKFGGTAFLAFFFIVFYRYFMKIRKYLKTFSDLQIHAHITETFAIYISAFGPSLYLISETFGCVSILSTDRCALLYECNIVVVQHLMTGAMFFGMSNFIFSRQTMTDLATFRNCDFPAFLRVTFVGFLSFIAFFAFGIRPKDSSGLKLNLYGYENESQIIEFTSTFKYIMGFSWAILITSFYYPMHMLLMMERQQLETGLATSDHALSSTR
jgi:hypothetical protein